jgi:hypothetical protein
MAQATRTWVSGTGDDANPCSRTAPCKTFAGAISKTAASGEINVIDTGGYGGVTITKALTIHSRNVQAGILVSGTNAIVVNAGVNDKVNLIGLNINGFGTSLYGIRVLQAKTVRVEDSRIFGFNRNAIDFEPVNASARLTAVNNVIHDNDGNGVAVTRGKATLRDNSIDDNGCGVLAASFGMSSALDYTQSCGANLTDPGGPVPPAVSISSSRNSMSDNRGGGVESVGPNAVNRIAVDDIFNNAVGLKVQLGGEILSFGNNHVGGNDVDGNPTGRIQTR